MTAHPTLIGDHPERGIVLGITLPHYRSSRMSRRCMSRRSSRWPSGRVVVIDNIGLMLPGCEYCRPAREALGGDIQRLGRALWTAARLYGNCNCRIDFHLTQISIMDVGMTEKIQRCVPVAMV